MFPFRLFLSGTFALRSPCAASDYLYVDIGRMEPFMTTSAQSPRQARPMIRWTRVLAQAQTILLIFIFGFFLAIHAINLANGRWTSVPFAVENIVLIAIFFTRRRSMATTTRPFDWAVAAIGGWGPLTFQLYDGGPSWLEGPGFAIQLAGLSLVSICFLGLGRSFGVVAANRGLKTRGPYQLVRHPIYACHIVTNIGFIMVNPHWINVAILAVVLVAQVMRMRAEERVLTESGDYAKYASEVRYRLIPGVY